MYTSAAETDDELAMMVVLAGPGVIPHLPHLPHHPAIAGPIDGPGSQQRVMEGAVGEIQDDQGATGHEPVQEVGAFRLG